MHARELSESSVRGEGRVKALNAGVSSVGTKARPEV
jgi:hypothetical protein